LSRPHGPALALLLAEVEVDIDAREHHQGIAADVEHLGAEEELLVGIDVTGDDVPVPHGDAGRVERRRAGCAAAPPAVNVDASNKAANILVSMTTSLVDLGLFVWILKPASPA
jgi:hypothetical protein